MCITFRQFVSGETDSNHHALKRSPLHNLCISIMLLFKMLQVGAGEQGDEDAAKEEEEEEDNLSKCRQ